MEDNVILSSATILDPRLKKIVFTDNSSADKAAQHVANEAAIQNSNADQHTSSSNDETEANNDDNDTSKEGSGLWDFFDQCVAECTAVHTAGIEDVTETSQYLKTKNLERKDDPIKW